MARLVVADDDPDYRFVARMALERSGAFEVVGEAADTEQAVSQVLTSSPDIVLLDCTMPGTDPLSAISGLRKIAPDAAIVLTSGHPPGDLRLACRVFGAVGFLSKETPPFRLPTDLGLVGGLVVALQSSLNTATAVAATEGVTGQELASETVLGPSPASVAVARRFVATSLGVATSPEVIDGIVLATSELVTNAVVHAGTDIALVVRASPRVVRIEVTDRSPGLPRVTEPRVLSDSGRGLAIVDTIAARWGVEHVVEGDGKTVWFEVVREQDGGEA